MWRSHVPKCMENTHLCDGIEINVILADELINHGILVVPPFLPLILIGSLRSKISLRKGNGCPKGLRPYPEGQVLFALDLRNGNAPFDIAGKAERHQGLSRRIMYACFLQHLPCKVSVIQGLEHTKKRFSLLLVNELMLWELRKKRLLIHAFKVFLRDMHGRLI